MLVSRKEPFSTPLRRAPRVFPPSLLLLRLLAEVPQEKPSESKQVSGPMPWPSRSLMPKKCFVKELERVPNGIVKAMENIGKPCFHSRFHPFYLINPRTSGGSVGSAREAKVGAAVSEYAA